MPSIISDHKFRVLFKYRHGYNYLLVDTASRIRMYIKNQGSKLFMSRPMEARIDPNYPMSAELEAQELFKTFRYTCHPHGHGPAFGIDKEDLTKVLIGMPGWATGNGPQFRPQRQKWEAEHGWRKFDSTT